MVGRGKVTYIWPILFKLGSMNPQATVVISSLGQINERIDDLGI